MGHLDKYIRAYGRISSSASRGMQRGRGGVSCTGRQYVFRRRRRRNLLRVAVILSVILVATLTLVGVGLWVPAGVTSLEADEVRGGSHAGSGTAGEPSAAEADRERFDVLVLGIDRRPGDEVEGPGSRTDAMMLARVFPETGEIKVVSIPRDLLVEVEPGVYDRINTAFARGGVSKAKDVVEDLTGIAADRHVVADFAGFEALVDALGGVEIDVEGELPPGWQMEAGPQELDGRQALLYARYRDTARGDLDRIERQQQLVDALREQFLKTASLTRLPGVIGALRENIETDVGPLEAGSIGRSLASGGEEPRLETVKLTGTPYTRHNGDQVLWPDSQNNAAVLSTNGLSEEGVSVPAPSVRSPEVPSVPTLSPDASYSGSREASSPGAPGSLPAYEGVASEEGAGNRGGYGTDQYGWREER